MCPFGASCCDCGSSACACPLPPQPPQPPEAVDVIFVGLGTAAAVAVSRLAAAHPGVTFAVLEQGAPLTKSVGGCAFPQPWAGQGVAAVDIPGLYPTLAYNAACESTRSPSAPWTWLGKGYGGNSEFNGMLWQQPRSADFDAWPEGWRAADMAPAFAAVRGRLNLTAAPSADGRHYNNATHVRAADVFERGGAAAVPSMEALDGLGQNVYSRPTFVTDGNGQRGGPVSAYLSAVIGSDGDPLLKNLYVVPNATAEAVVQAGGKASGVRYVSPVLGERTLYLTERGRVVLSAGSIGSPRLLYNSGIGPSAVQDQVCPQCPGFEVDVPEMGVIADHAGTAVSIRCDSPNDTFWSFNASNLSANAAAAKHYAASRSGPYAEYCVAAACHNATNASLALPDVEIFVNPFGLGKPGRDGPSNRTLSGPHDIGFNIMLLSPRSRDYLRLDRNGLSTYPNLYLRGSGEWEAAGVRDLEVATVALHNLLSVALDALPQCRVGFGPGAGPFAHLNPRSLADVRTYVQSDGDPLDGVYSSHLEMNHFCGTVPLGGAVEPDTLLVRGTANIHVADASLIPQPLGAHPVATVMAIGHRAADVLGKQL